MLSEFIALQDFESLNIHSLSHDQIDLFILE